MRNRHRPSRGPARHPSRSQNAGLHTAVVPMRALYQTRAASTPVRSERARGEADAPLRATTGPKHWTAHAWDMPQSRDGGGCAPRLMRMRAAILAFRNFTSFWDRVACHADSPFDDGGQRGTQRRAGEAAPDPRSGGGQARVISWLLYPWVHTVSHEMVHIIIGLRFARCGVRPQCGPSRVLAAGTTCFALEFRTVWAWLCDRRYHPAHPLTFETSDRSAGVARLSNSERSIAGQFGISWEAKSSDGPKQLILLLRPVPL